VLPRPEGARAIPILTPASFLHRVLVHKLLACSTARCRIRTCSRARRSFQCGICPQQSLDSLILLARDQSLHVSRRVPTTHRFYFTESALFLISIFVMTPTIIQNAKAPPVAGYRQHPPRRFASSPSSLASLLRHRFHLDLKALQPIGTHYFVGRTWYL
jgi:hypothetical protein